MTIRILDMVLEQAGEKIVCNLRLQGWVVI